MQVPVTFVMIAVTAITSWAAFSRPAWIQMMIMNPYRVHGQHEYYRLLTSGFIHGNFAHLLWNMFTFYFFGRVVEVYFGYIFGHPGIVYFIMLYLMGIVVSEIPTYLKRRHDPGYNSLGASGGVSAVVFASIILQPTADICFYFVLCLPGFLLGAAFLVWSYYNSKKPNSQINHEAHIYGALFGILYCVILYPGSVPLFIEQIAAWRIF